MKQGGFIAIVFVIGCATGRVAGQFMVPPARAATTPTRWEYFCLRVPSGALTSTLNSAGAEGWELASVTPADAGGRFGGDVDVFVSCSKRPLP